MHDIYFYKFTITVQSDKFGKTVEEGIVYSTKGYTEALNKVIMHFVGDESDLVSVDSLYPMESCGDVLDMYDLVQMVKDYEEKAVKMQNISSISKNISLKPSKMCVKSADGKIYKTLYACPRCLHKLYAPMPEEVFNMKSYCKKCGQPIDWG